MPFIAIGLVIAAALGGGTAALAQNSLPGDALWGFKVQINEGLQGVFSSSDNAHANWDINAINARLDEAEALAAKGNLSASSETKIDNNFDLHAHSVLSIIDNLQAHGDTKAAADIAAKFQAAVAQHATVLSQADANYKADVAATLAPIVLKVRATLDQASDVSASASAKANADSHTNTTTNDNGMTDTGVKANVQASTSVNIGL